MSSLPSCHDEGVSHRHRSCVPDLFRVLCSFPPFPVHGKREKVIVFPFRFISENVLPRFRAVYLHRVQVGPGPSPEQGPSHHHEIFPLPTRGGGDTARGMLSVHKFEFKCPEGVGKWNCLQLDLSEKLAKRWDRIFNDLLVAQDLWGRKRSQEQCQGHLGNVRMYHLPANRC